MAGQEPWLTRVARNKTRAGWPAFTAYLLGASGAMALGATMAGPHTSYSWQGYAGGAGMLLLAAGYAVFSDVVARRRAHLLTIEVKA